LTLNLQPTLANAKSERLSWEWRRVSRSFNKKENKAIIKQLQAWNLALRECDLEGEGALLDTETRAVENLRNTFDGEKTRRTRENAHALHDAIGENLGCTCPDGHRGSIRLNWHSDRPAADSFRLALSRTEAGPVIPSLDNPAWKMISAGVEVVAAPSITSSDPSTQSGHDPQVHQSSNSRPALKRSGSPTRSQRKYTSLKVNFLKQFNKKDVHISPAPVFNTNSLSPVQIPVLAPSTTVCGMLHLNHTNGAVIGTMTIPNSDPCKRVRILADENPQANMSTITRLIQLDAALSQVMDPVTSRQLGLHRKQRFGIAAGLAWAVLHLCESPWLATTLGDDNIHLFMHHEGGRLHLSSHPYLSHGFRPSASTPGSPMQIDNQNFAPPQGNWIRNMPLYTLAIRLIELGLGKPFTTLRNEYHASKGTTQSLQSSSDLDNFEVARHQLLKLQLDPSPSYATAVQQCLSLSFYEVSQRNTFQNSAFRKTFFEDVVAPVQATFDLIPGSAAQFF
jgi:hypothetical protein